MLSGALLEPVDELCDSDRNFNSLWFVVRLEGSRLGLELEPAVAFSEPNAASSVSAKLCTPNVFSRCFPVLWVVVMDSKSSTRFMIKVVGTLLVGAAG